MKDRILALDYGDVRTGTAYTDELGITVQPYKTIKNNGSDRILLKEIEDIIKEKNIKIIILGMPYNADGTKGERVEKTEKFLHKLKCRFPDISIEIYDERFTSLEADETMSMLYIDSKKRKELRDSFAAMHILESYLREKNI